MGTSCRFSVRRCAVTVISWIPSELVSGSAARAVAAQPAEELPSSIAMAEVNFGFERMFPSRIREIHRTNPPARPCVHAALGFFLQTQMKVHGSAYLGK